MTTIRHFSDADALLHTRREGVPRERDGQRDGQRDGSHVASELPLAGLHAKPLASHEASSPEHDSRVIEQLLEELSLSGAEDGFEVGAHIHQGARAAQLEDWPEHIGPEVRAAFAARGVHRPYAHQVQALRAIHEGKDLVIATPTASGKSLAYRAPILQACLDDSRARALMLFPTKALSRDQVEGFRELSMALPPTAQRIGAGVYDGDTPPDARRAARARARVLATNPDMLHRAILPNHERWSALFAGLRYVVLDELHTYRGVFGSHVANVLRRLWRICAFHGSRPQVIACSATIANPDELAARLISRSFVAGRGASGDTSDEGTGEPPSVASSIVRIDQSTAPQGAKHFLVLNPSVVDENTGVRRDYLKVSRAVTHRIASRGVSTLVFCRTRKSVELMTRYLREDAARIDRDRFGVSRGPVDPAAMARAKTQIRGYRGGYLPEHRREVERALRSGEATVVASTNALELGMDIGGLDAVVLAGYPGTRAATFQRVGRAGRRATPSLQVLVLSSKPLDQFVGADPDFLFGQPPEHARIDPDNPQILVPHLRCAAHELPIAGDEAIAGLPDEELQPLLEYLAQRGRLLRDERGGELRYLSLGGDFPAEQVDLRGSLEENFAVVEEPGPEGRSVGASRGHAGEVAGPLRAEDGRILAEVDYEDAPLYLHPGAIYPLDGRTYEVRELDWDARKAFVREVRSDYYTEAVCKHRVRLVDPVVEEGQDRRAGAAVVPRGLGYAHVVRAVPGFKKLRFGSHENIGFGPIELPDHELHTVMAWWRLPDALMATLPEPDRRARAALSAAHAVHHVAAMVCMCDVADLGHAVGAGEGGAWAPVTARARGGATGPTAELVATGVPTVYLYDKQPGGSGLSPRVYELGADFFARVRQVVAGCGCREGCPTCVGAEGPTESAVVGEGTPFGPKRDVLCVLDALREGMG